ncbi:MAG: ABC transporter ATP-binding protein/permease [Bifidobacterium tibiigranuli]|jgi:ATP-binding cassette subfamily B protein|uniref:ABC transporter ATP-binding protein n=1 Tax=Bifidobacterium tibiigranuli TaxID=2172043 RepID=UPI0023531BAB|nr:ABC transporter ATP-binding protein [Bifidobacterium tibiigranuli]MCH3975432.1 ABC transporter ATP-binding protein/permease [Bifidobacterium tibiigranuli]MCH4189670.1 ABC transporter ATP-binding protein/permease [Bifidobacterium tibiigranuli]MCH4204209.1 ABC transporter ATP-binding protein/permease [Bifidobacterium tibiigranuli]MCH4274594.1 ABC transporter ATP-binding protein/permease [Bifidobacterium tibiigranuli]MCI1791361.1 ABC transporter ATP-binding protein/permease [Bifidobacterium ti
MLRICKYLSRSEIGQLLIGLVFIVGQIWFDLKLPDYMSDITRLVETPGSNMHDIWVAGGKMLLISLGSVLCAIATGYVAARVGASFSQRLRSLEFRKVESFGPAEMSRFSTASLITRSTNDITQIQMFVTMGLLLLVKSPIMAVWAICKIAGKGVDWTIATAVAVGVLLVIIGALMTMVVPKFRSMQRLTDNINLVARENLTGLRVVRAYNAEDYQQTKYDEANKELSDTYLFTNRAMSVMMPLINTVMNGLMLAIYWIGAYLINSAGIQDKLTLFSNMVVFSSYSVQVIMSFLLMSMVFVLLPRADASADRILEVLDTDPMVADGAKNAAGAADAVTTATAAAPKGTVEFENVSFAYPDSREAMLEGITFSANPGQTVAFIGSTGSGKSSLVNLVPRFYDATEGQVLVDGVDVRNYTLKALRDKIGYVPQQSVLFKGTVASNIRYGDRPQDSADVELVDTSSIQGRRREAELMKHANDVQDLGDEQQVHKAAEVAQADEFIETMDGTYDAAIAQGGSNVSGGQKQRLSIARAVYRHPEILIFDDSFSALDFKTDRAVRDELAKEAKDSTKLIVAQRIGTIMDADRIVVLDDGKVVGQGTHRELLENCSVYREIAESQLSPDELAA